MKIAISIPDDIFQQAEAEAKKLGVSRSELYRRAVECFLEEQRGKAITQALNELYATESSELDPVLAKLQYASLDREEW